MKPRYVRVCKEFQFSAAHRLPDYPGNCANLHGHTWKLRVCFRTRVRDDGLSIDFSAIKHLVQDTIIQNLDHCYLNATLPMPTAENLCEWIWDQLAGMVHTLQVEGQTIQLSYIRLWESDTSFIDYQGGTL